MVQLVITVNLILFLYIAIFVSSSSGLDRRHFEAQEKLIGMIVKNHESTREILPTVNNTTPVILKVNIGLRQISTVDEVNQALRLNAWLRLYWNNPYLAWKPEDYDNVTSIHIDNSLLWTPDIAMYNKASLEEEIDILYKRLSTPVILGYDGNCEWLSPVTLLSQCRINVRRFPFDEQECKLIFGSWTYSALKLDVVSGGSDVNDFLPNGEWKVLKYPVEKNIKKYAGDIPYSDVTLTMYIQRQPLYYTLNLILPCTVIAILAFLSFVLPSNHGERVSLVITVLLAMSVYMLIVSSTLPQTSDAMPVIGTYFLCIIVEIALCLFATCFIAKLRDHESEMPRWLDHLVNKHLARFLFMSISNDDFDGVPRLIKSNGVSRKVDIGLNDIKLAENDIKTMLDHKLLQTLHDELAVLTNDVNKRQKREAKQRKWQNAAKVLDRFFLLLFSLIFIIVTAAVFA